MYRLGEMLLRSTVLRERRAQDDTGFLLHRAAMMSRANPQFRLHGVFEVADRKAGQNSIPFTEEISNEFNDCNAIFDLKTMRRQGPRPFLAPRTILWRSRSNPV